MRQRVWVVLLSAGMCTLAVPGCAMTNGSLLNYFRPEESSGPGKEIVVVQPCYIAEPRETADAAQSGKSGLVAKILQPENAVAQGQRVQNLPEWTGPPQALVPAELPRDPFPPPTVLAQPTPTAGVAPSGEPKEPLVAALYWLLKKDAAKALECLQPCEASNQEIFMRLLPALALLNEKKGDALSASDVSNLQEQLQGVLLAIRARSDLTVDKMFLCERIDGYGQFVPRRDGYAYKAGIGRQAGELVNVYIELRNITTKFQDHYYTTVLNSTMSIRDSQGTAVWKHNYRQREMPLQSLMPRSDCYRSYDFFVPASVPPGRYTLTIEVVDETNLPHRVAQKSVEFNITAP